MIRHVVNPVWLEMGDVTEVDWNVAHGIQTDMVVACSEKKQRLITDRKTVNTLFSNYCKVSLVAQFWRFET